MTPDQPTSRSLFVTVGTDHHPFHRLIRWVDLWLEDGGALLVQCNIQGGTSWRGRQGTFHDLLSYQEIQAAMGRALAVVCHGGPGTIMEARALAHVPIVVPRLRRLGEAVDDHQVAFARRLAEAGEVHLAETEARLRKLLDRVLVEPEAFRSDRARQHGGEAVQRFQELVDELISPCGASARRFRWRPHRFPSR